MRRVLAVAALALGVGLLAFFLLRGGAVTEEDQVREAIRSVADGARAGHANDTLEAVSLRYRDEDGLDREALKALLVREFFTRGPISVSLGPIGVKIVEPGRAEAEVTAALAEGVDLADLSLLPDDTTVMHFEVELEEEDGEWRVVSQRNERVFDR